jgi:predicted transcriptional regulator
MSAREKNTSSSALEAILAHDGRMDVLCCLLDGEPLTLKQLSARTGRPLNAVSHWVKLLNEFFLVERMGDTNGSEPRYAATLNAHPDWVRKAVENHRYD